MNSVESSPKKLFDNKIIFLFYFVLIGIIIVVFAFFYNINKSKLSEELINHTQKVLKVNDKLMIDMLQAESQSRGYLLSGNLSYLDSFKDNLNEIQKDIAELKSLTLDNEMQQERIDLLKKNTDERILIITNNIKLRKKSNQFTNENLNEVLKSSRLGNLSKSLILDFKQEEILLLKKRRQENSLDNDNLNIVFIFLLFFILAFLLLIALLVKNQREKFHISKELFKVKNIFESLFENNPTPISIQDYATGRFINANQRFLNLFEIDSVSLLADKSFTDLSIILEPKSLIEFNLLLNKNKVVIDFEIEIVKANNKKIWVSYSARILYIDNVPTIVSVLIDISSRLIAELALKKSIQEITDYKYALEDSYIIAITDNRGIIEFVNDNFCKISQFSREELIGRDHRIINSGYHSKEFFEKLYQTIHSGKIWRGEIKNKSKNGNIYWVDSTIVPFLDESGKPYQFVSIRIDITDRKMAQAQLEDLNKELEGFSYSVSHDLRAPLRAMNGHAKILLEDYSDKLDEDGLKSLNSIVRNSKKMGELIDGLLEFSKLGRKEIVASELNMNLIVDSVKEDLIDSSDKKIEFKFPDLISVVGQPLLIKQVWVNLISNAIKYSKKDVEISIEIKSVQKGNFVEYSVKDNGVGFDMKYYDKLFGVFQRLHSAEDFEGMGIGLAIVQKIIQRHKGSVWAESILDVGTVFYFSLPLNKN